MSVPLAESQDACREAERRLQHYVDRILTPADVRAIEAHLASCAHCANCYRFETEMREHVKRVCSEPCPETLKLRLRRLCVECDARET